jgi:capsular polysaccharide biosynthesis protein
MMARAVSHEKVIMELKLILRILWRYGWLIAIPVVITGALALPSLLNRDPAASGGFTTMFRYTAAQELDAIPNRDGDFQDVWLASELTVNAMTDWVQSSSFTSAVAEQALALGLTIDPAALGIAADNERSIGQVFISWPDADELATIIESARTALQTRNQDAFPQLGGQPAQVTILDDPVINPAPPPLTSRFEPIVRIGIGVILGLALALLAHYFDPVLRRREDVESLGLPVLVSIPRQ